MDNQMLWQIVLADLEVQVSKAAFRTFLASTKLLEISGKTATIGCSQPMLISLIEKRYYQLIKKVLDTYTKNDINLVFKPAPAGEKKAFDEPLFRIKSAPQISSVRLNPDYTFNNFAVSTSNQMAYAAATAVAKKPGVSYNPLFIYGGVGVGKTHLMQATAHAILKSTSFRKIIYCTGEEFTNEIIEAITYKTTVAFKKRYRGLNVLLIDDVQFIAGKNAVQEEFFHTFNSIQQIGGQIILTSDRPPEEINKLEARLRSRFEGGLIVDIGPPDFELRCAILLIKTKQRGIDLPLNLVKLIAANVENPRKLEGVFIRILSESEIRNVPIDEELVKNTLGKIIKQEPRKNSLKPEDAINTVASYFKLKISQLKGNRRDKLLSLPRQILYYILRSELNMPLEEIGNVLGGRDHTTVLYGVRKISEMIPTNKILSADVLGIKQKLYG